MIENKLIRRSLPITVLCLTVASVSACPVCEKQQPKLLKGITHGTGPQGNLDYVIITIAALIVLITLFYSVKWLIRPGEQADGHIKQIILNTD